MSDQKNDVPHETVGPRRVSAADLPDDAISMIQFPLRRAVKPLRCGVCDCQIPAGGLIVVAQELPICTSSCVAVAIYGSDKPGQGAWIGVNKISADPKAMRQQARNMESEAEGLEDEARGLRSDAEDLYDRAGELEKRLAAAAVSPARDHAARDHAGREMLWT